MKTFNVFDPDLDLKSSLLLEASAGTGKTYSIENIVARVLAETSLSIKELLIVTFTKAAAKDLKERIKKCLEKAPQDRRIKRALVEFDQALISTIHSFCFKALAENTAGFRGQTDDASMIIWEVIERHFRTTLTRDAYSPKQLNILLKPHRNSVTDLTRDLISIQGRGIPFVKSLTNAEGLRLLEQTLKGMEPLIEAIDTHGSSFKTFSGNEEMLASFFQLFGRSPLTMQDIDPVLEEGAAVLSLLSLKNKKVKSQVPPPVMALFDTLQEKIVPLLYQLGSYSTLFIRLASECREKLFAAFEEEDACDFTYLLYKMERLSQDPEFRKNLSSQYKMVIIDEFQDTDPLQWNIFHRVFGEAGIPLILVGDPKQSIYAFRSADIYTYLKAKDTIPSQYLLDTNYRSSPGLIRALNLLFSAPGWIALPHLKKELPYHPVKPAPGKEEAFSPSLEILSVKKTSLEQAEEQSLFPYFLQEVRKLKEKGISFSEMAFIVRDHAQSDRLFQFFSANALPSYQLRGVDFSKASVLQDFIYVMRALASPRNIGTLQTALGTCFFGWPLEKILELKEHEPLAQIVLKFHTYSDLWKKKSLGIAFQAILSSSYQETERTIQEHLASTYEGRLLYHEALQILEWIEKKEDPLKELEVLLDANLSQENMQLRPLVEKEAAPILTLHMSKGLEFEAVFALGAINQSPIPDDLISIRDNEKSYLKAAPKGHPEYLAFLEENDAEKARQLYVALTRAKSKLYLPILEGGKAPALGRASPIDLLLEKIDLETLCSQDIAIIKIPENVPCTPFAPKEAPEIYPPKIRELTFPPRYSLSFTALAKKGSAINTSAPHDFNPQEFSPHTLPAGAATGEMIHELLEKVPLELVHKPDSLLLFVQKHLAHTYFEPWKEVIAQILYQAFHTPLGPDSIQLGSLSEGDLFREMEFMYPVKDGVMKGVIDLFFLHKRKYYLLDWKTNWLGSGDEDYHDEALANAMTHHSYTLQADLYLNAVREYLQKIETRPFEDIFGGVIYYFLRGNRAYYF